MIIDGGHLRPGWEYWLEVGFITWLRNIGERAICGLFKVGILVFLFCCSSLVYSQNCDVDFPGISQLTFSDQCGGSSNNLILGKNTAIGTGDQFSFDAPNTIIIQGGLEVFANGNGRIVIPAGVKVIVEGNMDLRPTDGQCDGSSPCTFTLVVNGHLRVMGNLKNQLQSLVWEGLGTVEVFNTLENTTDACMSCGLTCPAFPITSGGCKDDGSRCAFDFCTLNYGNACLLDLTKPQIENCPADMVLSAASNCSAVATWNPPLASDNCEIESFVASHEPGAAFPLGSTTVTYTATDASGLSVSCSFQIEVVDDATPIFSNCPADTVVIETGDNSAAVNWIEPTVADNCSNVELTSSHSPGEKFPVGTTQVSYLATDDFGNSQNCTFSIKVLSELPPPTATDSLIVTYKAFSPNGDGINDSWVIENIEKYHQNTVLIYDRWGSVIYEASGYNNQSVVWNGQSNRGGANSGEVVPAGTYFFNITLHGIGSEKGYLELLD